MGLKPYVAPPPAAGGTLGERALQSRRHLGHVPSGAAGVAEDGAGHFGNHGVELRRVGQIEGEDKIVIGHAVEFYSERRLKSTRARRQSASICARSNSSDSNARSSRRR